VSSGASDTTGSSTTVIPNTVSALTAVTVLRFRARLEDLSQLTSKRYRSVYPFRSWLVGHSFPKRARNGGRITVPLDCYFIGFWQKCGLGRDSSHLPGLVGSVWSTWPRAGAHWQLKPGDLGFDTPELLSRRQLKLSRSPALNAIRQRSG